LRYLASPDIQDLEWEWCCANTSDWTLIVFSPKDCSAVEKYKQWADRSQFLALQFNSLEEMRALAKETKRDCQIWYKGKLCEIFTKEGEHEIRSYEKID